MGYIVWQGKSELDGQDIVVIATNKSSNTKTGDMIQIWILLDSVDPIKASQTGLDSSVCGNCIHRGQADGVKAHNRSCYVQLFAGGPQSVWHAYKNGKYKSPFDLNFVKNKLIRFGAFGDPLAVPEEVWQPILKVCRGWTGYTHAWKSGKGTQYLMASVDSEREYLEAKALGYRTFRVRSKDSELLKTEIACPAAIETGKRLTCERCLACNGSNGNSKRRDISIILHGGSAVKANGERNLLKVLQGESK